MAIVDTESSDLIPRLQQGDHDALGEAFARHRDRLWRMVQFRLDRRLAGRVDPDDILQEAFLDAQRRVQHYLDRLEADPAVHQSLFVWLRLIVQQTLVDVHRRHVGAQMRSADREVSLHAGNAQATSISLAAGLLANSTTPSGQAMRGEMEQQLETALASMSKLDQEIIALRHFEELTNQEVAEVLEIQPKAASIRYVRAVKRLRSILSQWPQCFGI